MRPIELDIDLENAATHGLAHDADSSGTSLTLNGTLSPGGIFTSLDGLGRIIIITDTSSKNQAAATFTITGTDANDDSISEAITGPGSGLTVASTKYYKTLTSVAIASAISASTVDIGTRGTTLSAVSRYVPLNFYNSVAALVSVDVTGTLNFSVQQTFDDALTQTDAGGNLLWVDVTALASKTADTTAQLSLGATACRVVINTYTDTAELQARIIQSLSDNTA